MFRQLARQLAKVLRGEKVSDLPVEQPTTFGLAVNLKTAKAIGFFNDDVLSLDVAAFAQPGPESLVRHRSAPRGGEQHANSVHSPCVLRRCRRRTSSANRPRANRSARTLYRGHGQSQYDRNPSNYTIRIALADLSAVLAALEITSAIFVGTSFGGVLAMMLAVLPPIAVAGV